jgi:F0F1-type ATP synthase assembly protein I
MKKYYFFIMAFAFFIAAVSFIGKRFFPGTSFVIGFIALVVASMGLTLLPFTGFFKRGRNTKQPPPFNDYNK